MRYLLAFLKKVCYIVFVGSWKHPFSFVFRISYPPGKAVTVWWRLCYFFLKICKVSLDIFDKMCIIRIVRKMCETQ